MDWQLEVVVVPVTDVERAKRFYSEQAGFAVDVDTQVGSGMRIVQMTPPGSTCSITVGPLVVDTPPKSTHQMQLVVSDIEAARNELLERNLEVSEIQHFENGVQVSGKGGDWNSFMFFSDPDGNRWAIQERPARD